MRRDARKVWKYPYTLVGFLGGSGGKESAYYVGNLVLNPGLGRSSGKGNGYPLQYSCLASPMDRRLAGRETDRQSVSLQRVACN